MRLAWNQLRKDVHLTRVPLGLWLGFLLLDLGTNLGWFGEFTCDRHGYTGRVGAMGAASLPVWLFLFEMILCLVVVLTDSPSRSDGFLATRPVPARDRFLGKLLYIGILVVGMRVVQEVVYLGASGIDGGLVLRAAMETLVVHALLCAGNAVFASLWRDPKQFAAGLLASGLSLAGIWLAVATVALLGPWHIPEPELDEPGRLLAAATMLVAGLALLCRHAVRERWGFGRRAAGVVVLEGAVSAILLVWPWYPFAVAPGAGGVEPMPLRAGTAAVSPTGIRFGAMTHRGTPGVSLNLAPDLSGLPSTCEVAWRGTGGRLLASGGTRGWVVRPFAAPRGPIQGWRGGFVSQREMQAWNACLGGNMLFRADHVSGTAVPDAAAGWLAFEDGLPAAGDVVSFSGSMEAILFRWELVGELALAPGSDLVDGASRWTLVAADRSGEGVNLAVRLEQLTLWSSRGQQTSGTGPPIGYSHALLLRLPERAVAVLPEGNSLVPRATLAGHTSRPRVLLRCGFQGSAPSGFRPLSEEDLETAKLVVLRKRFTDRFTVACGTGPFRVPGLPGDEPATVASAGERLPRGQLDARFAELPVPEPGASRDEVGRYLLAVIRLLDAHERPLPRDHTLCFRLAETAGAHLPVFLEATRVARGFSRQTLLAALADGLREEHRDGIVEALPSLPDLLVVVLERGWLEAARPALEKLLLVPGPLALECFRALAWSGNAVVYPRLLEEFERAPSVDRYDVLFRIPDLREALDACVQRIWANRPRQMERYQLLNRDVYAVALRHGCADAPADIARRLHELDEREMRTDWAATDAIRQGVRIPGMQPRELHDPGCVLSWFREQDPDTFRYDPVRRRFTQR
ncbi:MAG: hypothetical protein JXR77_14645 [Lentisphaeria bacterium]|nr:hypothetical protein [Lentisphaeria bacterium]